jgi:hypothetical protein
MSAGPRRLAVALCVAPILIHGPAGSLRACSLVARCFARCVGRAVADATVACGRRRAIANTRRRLLPAEVFLSRKLLPGRMRYRLRVVGRQTPRPGRKVAVTRKLRRGLRGLRSLARKAGPCFFTGAGGAGAGRPRAVGWRNQCFAGERRRAPFERRSVETAAQRARLQQAAAAGGRDHDRHQRRGELHAAICGEWTAWRHIRFCNGWGGYHRPGIGRRDLRELQRGCDSGGAIDLRRDARGDRARGGGIHQCGDEVRHGSWSFAPNSSTCSTL